MTVSPISNLRYVDQSSPEYWSDAVTLALKNPDLTPDELLKALNQNPLLKYCYTRDAGVSEGYTVGEHTIMVLDLAYKYRHHLSPRVTKLVDWNEFLLFLALHDIGKGVAKDSEVPGLSTALSFKQSELENCREIVAQIMQKLDVSKPKIDLFKALLAYDSQGLYIKREIGIREAHDNILEMSRMSGVPAQDVYMLLSTFHMVDAGSYPILRRLFIMTSTTIEQRPDNQKRIDELNNLFLSTDEGEKAFFQLLRMIENGQEPKDIRDVFLTHIDRLQGFLVSTHKEMLASTDSTTEKQQQRFKRVKTGFRDILRALTKNGNPQKVEDLEPSNDANLRKLTADLVNFRRHYLYRYGITKVQAYVERSIPHKAVQFNDTAQNLLKTTFFHGTNSGILPGLLQTGLQLLPSGRLLRYNIVPFSGELQNGAGACGTNSRNISGTQLAGVERARYSYAFNTSFHCNQNEEVKKVEWLLKNVEGLLQKRICPPFRPQRYHYATPEIKRYDRFSTGYEEEWTRAIVAIRRLRVLDSKKYSLHFEERLKDLLEQFDNEWELYKTKSPGYREFMPKNEDPTGELGYGWHDYYWYNTFKNIEGVIEQWGKAVNEPVSPVPGIEQALKTPFPLLFASKTLHTATHSVDGQEWFVQKAARLGKDIQFIVAQRGDHSAVHTFLQNHGLARQVTVVNMGDLANAELINKIADPYLRAITGKTWMKWTK